MTSHPLFGTLLPRDWELTTVDDIKSPEPSSCVAGPFGSNISSKYFVTEGVPVIRGSNLRDDLTPFVPTGFVFVSEERARAYAAQHVRSGDLVFTCWGTVGQVGLIPSDGPFAQYIISNKQLKLRPNLKRAESRYLFYYFASPEMVNYVRSRAIGAAVPGINLGILKGLPVVLPPVVTQRRIVNILSAYDDLIVNCECRIRVLDEMARSLYREWFVLFRYPGHEKMPLVDSPLGRIPKGWQCGPLGTVAQVNAQQIDLKHPPSHIRYIDISSVSPGRIDSVTEYAFADAPGRARRIVRHGDVLWSCVRPNRRSHVLVLHPEDATIASTGFAVIRAENASFSYLYAATTTDEFVDYLEKRATGAAYPAVTAKVFEDAPLLIPDASTLERFAAAANPQAETIALLQRRIDNLRKTRDLLLPRLLSGQLSVEEVPA